MIKFKNFIIEDIPTHIYHVGPRHDGDLKSAKILGINYKDKWGKISNNLLKNILIHYTHKNYIHAHGSRRDAENYARNVGQGHVIYQISTKNLKVKKDRLLNGHYMVKHMIPKSNIKILK